MKINYKYYLIGLIILLLSFGCGQPDKKKENKVSGFKTNRSNFIATLDKSSPNTENRNALMNEFIVKSDVQCQHYLDGPLPKPKKEEGMYMKVYDATGTAFGVKNITDGAKTLYTGGDKEKNKDPNSVLSPEIKRGVELAREKYARTNMYSKKYKLIESYTNEMLEQDMQNYDKLCNHEVGLTEINKALKKMQKKPKKVSPFSPKLVIDPIAIKNKAEAAKKEAEAEAKNENNITSSVEVLDMSDTYEANSSGF